MGFIVRTRAELLADYVIETGATVRQAAINFGVSKAQYIRISLIDLSFQINRYTTR